MLEVSGIEAFYGASQALFGIDLAVDEGAVVALMGRNGMGKTTTIRAICGLTPARAGAISFAGADIRRLKSHRIARLGIGLVPEGRRCFPNLTVRENLVAAARDGKWTLDAVVGLFPRLGERTAQYASTLSGGEQQMLAIGRALMTNPRLLILDEATEGLAPVIRQDIWRAIRCDFSLLMSAPAKEIAPVRAGVRPQMARMVVVLPMPLRPIRATTAPSSTARSTPNSAWLAP